MKQKIKILHLAPHIGAGVGTVVFNYLDKAKQNLKFEHKLLILGYADERAIKASKEMGFSLSEKMADDHDEILKEIEKSDIVLIHWWNHPLLSDFLIRNKLPPSRIVIWCHISGNLAPNNLTEKILKYPDVFVFTTPLSYNTKEVKNLPHKYKTKIKDIWSTGGIDHLKNIKIKKHKDFNIGYIGNVDYAKMHPDFLEMSNSVNIPDVHFTIVGGPNGKQMEQEVKNFGLSEKFTFTGFVTEKEKWGYLSTFDVFGYPLAPHHYGSCDQVLQEAMAAGVVPVVLANPMEQNIVKDKITGIVAKNKKEYARVLEQLKNNPELRKKLSHQAKKYAFDRFSLKRMVEDWENVFNEVLSLPKTQKQWEINKKKNIIKPKDIFIESLGRHNKPFISYCKAKDRNCKQKAIKKIKELAKFANWQSESKSTVHNFNTFLPGDKYLSEWSKIMKNK